jgi:hypothetical protein
MSETVKINLTKIGAGLIIVISLASVVGAGYIAYDNAKSAKTKVDALEHRVQTIETERAKFEGMIDERTKNTAQRVEQVYDIVKEWKPTDAN